jgi:hypothetical protein
VNQANITRFNTFANTTGNTGGLARHYRLVENVTLSPAPANGSNWTAIGGTTLATNFTGNFDGGGHTISGLSINNDSNLQGMFGHIGTGGTVRNLGLVDVNISGSGSNRGGIAGRASSAIISNSYVIGNVEGRGTTVAYIGGVVGRANASTVSNCYVIADIIGYGSGIGGVVGYGTNIKITNCYVIGSVHNRSNGSMGGVLGYIADSTAEIENTIALNHTVTARSSQLYVGRVVHEHRYTGVATLTNNRAWDGMDIRHGTAEDGTGGTVKSITTTGTLTGVDGLSITRAETRARETWDAANFAFGNDDDNPWVWEEGKLPRLYFEPVGRNWPIWVTNEEELRMVGRGEENPPGFTDWTLDKHYVLTTNITLTGGNWAPIGPTTDNPFSGGFDGSGNTISGLTINNSSNNQGMFGFLTGAVKNLGLVDLNIRGSGNYRGGIAADAMDDATISNSYVIGNIAGTTRIGGVVGQVSGTAVISNCYVIADVSGNGTSIGGVVGRARAGHTKITNCYAIGSVHNRTTGSTSGVLGYIESNGAEIKNTIALNHTVTAGTSVEYVGRVTSLGRGSGTRVNNRAWSGMSVFHSTDVPVTNHGTGDLNGRDGLSISSEAVQTQSTWGADGAQFAFGTTEAAPWVWEDGKMPRFYFEPVGRDWPCEILGNCPVVPPSPQAITPTAAAPYALNIVGSNIVTSEATFVITAPEGALSTIVVYDYMGNVVFVATGVRSGERVVWDLTNMNGRPVSAGSYLAISASRDRGGKALRGSVRLGVGR